MIRSMQISITIILAFAAAGMMHLAAAQTPASAIGIVIMHGKGGSPRWYVSDLATSLEGKGFIVSNLEMPWSGRRSYDVSVSATIAEAVSALDALRGKGARKVFVAGHSLGGLFALHFGGRQSVDGIIAIAPGGDVSNSVFREKLGDEIDSARKLVSEGRGDEKARLSDYENAKGTYTVVAAPSAYLSWFDPDGAMNQTMAVKGVLPQIPILYIVPTGDYPGLQRVKHHFFSLLPKHPLTRLYEPNASHVSAPSASSDEIARWVTEAAIAANPALQVTPAGGRP